MHRPEAAKATSNSQKKEAPNIFRRRFSDMKLLSTESDYRPVKEVTYLKIWLSTLRIVVSIRVPIPQRRWDPIKGHYKNGFCARTDCPNKARFRILMKRTPSTGWWEQDWMHLSPMLYPPPLLASFFFLSTSWRRNPLQYLRPIPPCQAKVLGEFPMP